MEEETQEHLASVETFDTDLPEQRKTPSAKQSFAKLLRTIGQALDAQNVASLELAYHSGVYFVRTVAARTRKMDRSFKGVIGELLAGLGIVKSGSSENVVAEIQYDAEDIEQLENDAKSNRSNDRAMPDPFTLAERLRTVGSVIDANPNRSLVTVTASKEDGQVSFCYLSETGELRDDHFRVDNQYEAWKKRYLKRKNRMTAR